MRRRPIRQGAWRNTKHGEHNAGHVACRQDGRPSFPHDNAALGPRGNRLRTCTPDSPLSHGGFLNSYIEIPSFEACDEAVFSLLTRSDSHPVDYAEVVPKYLFLVPFPANDRAA